MAMTLDTHLRNRIRTAYLDDEAVALQQLLAEAKLTLAQRQQIVADASDLVHALRKLAPSNLIQDFLTEYGLSNKEGIALMCLAEALLRIPDTATISSLIADKIAGPNWDGHLGRSSSLLVNASSWGLMLTGRLLSPDNLQHLLPSLAYRLGQPLVRLVISKAMRRLGGYFILGKDIYSAMRRASVQERRGYLYSYDMLGEAALCDADALRYHQAYITAIRELSKLADADVRSNPGVSVKLSALYPRYEYAKKEDVIEVLTDRVRTLALMAKRADMGFNLDAEEADRLDLSLDIIDSLLSDPNLDNWDGFGIVVQAYGPRTPHVIDWIYQRAGPNRRLMVRLVKGAYWDTEIKRAQVMGLSRYPVFTQKAYTDVSYIACARKLLQMGDRLYPQFATHNAHTIAAVQRLAEITNNSDFEFQRLHGMGEALHEIAVNKRGYRCRVYAPVGSHQDLLAYLVRRLLENGANSSFVSRIVDPNVAVESVAEDPFSLVQKPPSRRLPLPPELFGAERNNSTGWDLTDPLRVEELTQARDKYASWQWQAAPMLAKGSQSGEGKRYNISNPANRADEVGSVQEASAADVEAALEAAREGFKGWSEQSVESRASCLERVADAYEEATAELCALCAREAGKTLPDCISELREAVDFLRYYAACARQEKRPGRGLFICISPWNFPLAIFTGQIAAALAAGNVVIAKPAEQTPLIAARAIELMRAAGVPDSAVQLVIGDAEVGAQLTQQPMIDGVCFTGSTAVAQQINRCLAEQAQPTTPLIAETGGLNAMIADSTALPEQLVKDIIASAFQSAGQRCSALRILYLQQEIAAPVIEMLTGAMAMLDIGDPWLLKTDVGPVISAASYNDISRYCQQMEAEGRLLYKVKITQETNGFYVPPTLFKVSGISELPGEIFGPVLHLATYKAGELEALIESINAAGYGLTFGLHSRLDSRVHLIENKVAAGNLYVNRNQIGAVVGSQPFGGQGLSGTGPKAGGPNYLSRFCSDQSSVQPKAAEAITGERIEVETINSLIQELQGHQSGLSGRHQLLANLLDRLTAVDTELAKQALKATPADTAFTLPGPTGEMNRLEAHSRGLFLCLGVGLATALAQAIQSLATGGAALCIAPGAKALTKEFAAIEMPLIGIEGRLDADDIAQLRGFAGIACSASEQQLRQYRRALAALEGAILPLITSPIAPLEYTHEQTLCIDTTAAGGNAALLAGEGYLHQEPLGTEGDPKL